MTAPLLETRGLRVKYGNVEALHGIDIVARQGEIVSILGANGAGKSTTLRAISGLLRPSGGEIRYDGKPAAVPPLLSETAEDEELCRAAHARRAERLQRKKSEIRNPKAGS